MKSGSQYKILLSKIALKDKIKIINSGLGNNCQKILNKMIDNPFCYPPPFEKLSGNLKGYYSRRINRQHRIVYRVNEASKEIYIIRLWTHYEK